MNILAYFAGEKKSRFCVEIINISSFMHKRRWKKIGNCVKIMNISGFLESAAGEKKQDFVLELWIILTLLSAPQAKKNWELC